MITRRLGPFDTASFTAGLLAATPLLLFAAAMVGGASGNGVIAATLAISGLALGAIAAGFFVATYINAHLTSKNEKGNPDDRQ